MKRTPHDSSEITKEVMKTDRSVFHRSRPRWYLITPPDRSNKIKLKSSAKAGLFVCPKLRQIIENKSCVLTFSTGVSKIILAQIEYQLIKSDGGTGPVKSGNLQQCKVPNPAV